MKGISSKGRNRRGGLYKWLAGHELPALVELLRELPWTHTIPDRQNVLTGTGLAAMPGG